MPMVPTHGSGTIRLEDRQTDRRTERHSYINSAVDADLEYMYNIYLIGSEMTRYTKL